MGSNSSLMVSLKSSSSPRNLSGSSRSIINRTKRRLSSLFCASFNSKSTFELEDCPEKSFATNTKKIAPVSSDFHDSMVESSSVLSPHIVSTSSLYENGDSSRDEAFVESSMINLRTSTDHIDFLNPTESLPFQPGEELVSENATNCISTADAPDATAEITPSICSAHDQSRSLSQGLTVSRADSDNIRHHPDFPGDDHSHVTTISSPGFVLSNSDQDLRNVLHLDELSISSNLSSSSIGEISHESRRHGRRLFWDALSRRSFRQHSESPTTLLTGDHADDHPGSHMRRLFDSGGNLNYNGAGYDLDSFSDRRRHRSERRRQSRSEISERIIGSSGLHDGGRETILCVSGLHPDDTCSCDLYLMAEESSTLENISRIIMLAEALFEVLDEIHHQSLSLSESLLPLPAPESLVDTFPLKYHEKVKNIESDPSNVQQCYICLADYEDGDILRVLPCNHGYHVPCIDKWLKEINRVCPLCRHNVCDGDGECSDSNMAIPS